MPNKQKAWRLGAAIMKGLTPRPTMSARSVKQLATVLGAAWRRGQGSSRHLSQQPNVLLGCGYTQEHHRRRCYDDMVVAGTVTGRVSSANLPPFLQLSWDAERPATE